MALYKFPYSRSNAFIKPVNPGFKSTNQQESRILFSANIVLTLLHFLAALINDWRASRSPWKGRPEIWDLDGKMPDCRSILKGHG